MNNDNNYTNDDDDDDDDDDKMAPYAVNLSAEKLGGRDE